MTGGSAPGVTRKVRGPTRRGRVRDGREETRNQGLRRGQSGATSGRNSSSGEGMGPEEVVGSGDPHFTGFPHGTLSGDPGKRKRSGTLGPPV